MDCIKPKNANLVLFAFFISVNIINSVYFLVNTNFERLMSLFIINSILAAISFLLYKIDKIKIELEIPVLLLLWATYKIIFESYEITDYNIMISISIMILLKHLRIRIIYIISISLFLVVLSTCSMMINEGNVARVINQLLLITVTCFLFYFIFYNEYKEIPDIKKLYNLTKLDMIILDSLFLPDPCLKTIQDYVLSKDKHCSNTYVKDRLQQLYKIFDVAKGGSRKTELLGKIIRLGYKI